MLSKDGRLVARENERRVLRALHRFGWLRTRDVAALVWQRWMSTPNQAPSLTLPVPTAAGVRMAQRTLRRLRERRQVLNARAPNGSSIYALSEAGVRALQHSGISSTSGKDLVRSFSAAHFRHRCIANEIAVSGILQGFRVATEREIARGLWFGGEDGVAGKKPDVLIRGGDCLWWVEVERSRKNSKDYSRLVNWLGTMARDAFRETGSHLLAGNVRWGKVIFICTPAFKAKLTRDLTAAGWKEIHINKLLSFDTSLYSPEAIYF